MIEVKEVIPEFLRPQQTFLKNNRLRTSLKPSGRICNRPISPQLSPWRHSYGTTVMNNIIMLISVFIISSCAPISPHYQQPSVGLKSFRIIPNPKGVLPEFEIGLHIINPNRRSIPLKGVFYTISLEDEKLLSGVANNLPTIKGYGETDINLHATVDLVGGLQLINKLLKKQQATMKYTFSARIDTGMFSPPLHIKEEGNLSNTLHDTSGNEQNIL